MTEVSDKAQQHYLEGLKYYGEDDYAYVDASNGDKSFRRRDGSQMYRPPRPAMTRDRVRHVGQSLALVVAETVNRQPDTPGFKHYPHLVDLLDFAWSKAVDPAPPPTIDGDEVAIQPPEGVAKWNTADAQLGG